MNGMSGLYKNTYGARADEIDTTDALIRVDGEEIVLLPSASAMLAEFERQVDAIKKKQDELKQRILAEMEANGIIKIDTDDLTISYVAPTNREKFDSKAFRKDHPDLYDDYVSISPIKASVRMKLK